MKLKMFAGFDLTVHQSDRLNVALRRGRALIAYLAVKDGHRESREFLVDLLWPNRFREQALASLRQVLFELRKRCGDPAPLVVATRTEVALGPAIEDCDVWAFEACTPSDDPADAERALQLYAGPFLDGPTIGAETFQHWVAIQQARLEGQLEKTVIDAAHRCNEDGSDERAAAMLERLLQISPMCHEATLLLLETDARNGRVADALRKYERYARHLKLEFDLNPPPEVQDAYETLRSAPLRRKTFSAPQREVAYRERDPWRKRSSDSPVIAVLPFRCLSERSTGQDLASAMCEDITLMLSGCRWFRVLSRSATHSLPSQETFVIRDFVQKTGADYLVYGAISERGSDWSVTVELADAGTGMISWARRYDATGSEIIAWAREVCPLIVAALDPALAENETRFSHKPALSATGSVDAYRDLVSGYRQFYSGNWFDAIARFTAATRKDETYAHAHAMLAVTRYLDAQVNRNDDWREQMSRAEKRARRALEIDPSEAKACNILGQILDWQGLHDESFDYLQRAVTLNPSFAWASTGHSYHALMMGAFDDAKSYIRTALRLRVGDSGLGLCLPARALADLHLGHYEDALGTAHWATRMQPNFWLGRQVLAACLLAAGDERNAGQIVEALRRDYGSLSSEEFAGWFPYHENNVERPVLDTLRHFGWH
mgnify:FL=1